MSSFELDRNKIPSIKMKHSVMNSFDDHFVIYEIDGLEFVDSSDEEDLDILERKIYANIAWYERLLKRNS